MKNKKTYQELQNFNVAAGARLKKNENDKLAYAIKKVIKPLVEKMGEYNEKTEDINIKHCAVGDDGCILRNEKGELKFTKEGQIAANDEIRKLWKTKVELEMYYVDKKDIPKDLSDAEREVFSGIVINPVDIKD